VPSGRLSKDSWTEQERSVLATAWLNRPSHAQSAAEGSSGRSERPVGCRNLTCRLDNTSSTEADSEAKQTKTSRWYHNFPYTFPFPFPSLLAGVRAGAQQGTERERGNVVREAFGWRCREGVRGDMLIVLGELGPCADPRRHDASSRPADLLRSPSARARGSQGRRAEGRGDQDTRAQRATPRLASSSSATDSGVLVSRLEPARATVRRRRGEGGRAEGPKPEQQARALQIGRQRGPCVPRWQIFGQLTRGRGQGESG